MSDFEKEMTIIQWMVQNIAYDYENYQNGTVPGDSYTEYGALVKKAAVCAGYSEGFQKLSSACGLTVSRVSGKANGIKENGEIGWSGHAWNQICLDGEWYNVDVTWEDPVGWNEYGFGNLRNRYINISDERLALDHDWTGGNVCNSYTYGYSVVSQYLLDGTIDTSKAVSDDEYAARFINEKIKNTDGTNIIAVDSKEQALEEFKKYFIHYLDTDKPDLYGEHSFKLAFDLASKSIEDVGFLQDEIKKWIDDQYGFSIIYLSANSLRIEELFPSIRYYYIDETLSFFHYPVTFHFYEAGTLVSTVTETGQYGSELIIPYPSGYGLAEAEEFEIQEGNALFTAYSYMLTEKGALTVNVMRKTVNQHSCIVYYVSETEMEGEFRKQLDFEEFEADHNSTVKIEVKEFSNYEFIGFSTDSPSILISEDGQVTLEYENTQVYVIYRRIES